MGIRKTRGKNRMDITKLVDKISEKYEVNKFTITKDLVKQETIMFQKELTKTKNPTKYFYLAAGHIIEKYKEENLKIKNYIKNNIENGNEVLEYFYKK